MIKYLEKLLNGREVEWKKLGDVCDFQNGFAFKSNLFKEYGESILRITNISNGIINEEDLKYFFINDYKENLDNYIVNKNDIVIAMSGATTGKIGINNTDKKFYLNQRVGKFIPHSTKLNNRFLYHILLSKSLEILQISSGSGAQPNLSTENINNLIIPIPPLDIQEEIVRVLDKFTDYTKELTKELTLRKKEYNYYRDYLLKLEDEVEIVKLGNVVEVYDGTHQTPNYKTEGIPFISVENIADIYNTEKYISEDDYEKNYKITPQIDDVFMTRIGTVGKCAVVTQNSPLAYYVSLALLRPDKNKINSRYLKHIIESQVGKKELNKRILHTAIPIKINKSDIDKLEFPLPTLEIQERIVNVLDNFEKICNDLNIGLPKEIELRQKEYEYYRESILTNIGNRITLEDKTRQDKTRQDKTRQYNIIKIYQYIYGSVIVEGDNVIKLYNDGVNFDSKNNKYYSIEYKKLGDICDYEQPNKYIVSSKMYKEEYNIPVLTAGKTFILGYTNEEKGIYEASKNSVIIFDDFTTDNKWVDFDFKVKSSAMKIISSKNVNQILLKYVYYWLNTIPKNNIVEEHKRQWISNYANKIIPIPPIEIQQKIVSKLDKLETIINSISYGLPKEIELRTKQYEYYREQLLTFDK